jgi:membrane protease YdiL (CAAX protease family)
MLRLPRRYPLVSYFTLAYAVSALALFVIGPPRLDASARSVASEAMFPVMVIAVGVIGVALTASVGGGKGLRELRSRMTRLPWRWLPVLAIPPVGILLVLEFLRTFVGPSFTPGLLVYGIAAGVVAGFFEEIGWTGFAFPRLRARFGALGGALLLGLLWGVWHLPVVDSLGAASPHDHALPAFFAAFVAVVIAVRVLIAWVYANTGSVLMAQLTHASSTGFLVVLSAPGVSPSQEAAWYLAYAALLWVAAGLVIVRYSPSLAGRAGMRPTHPGADLVEVP